jgi:hypothetical protein
MNIAGVLWPTEGRAREKGESATYIKSGLHSLGPNAGMPMFPYRVMMGGGNQLRLGSGVCGIKSPYMAQPN